jgi:hypothetical protein
MSFDFINKLICSLCIIWLLVLNFYGEVIKKKHKESGYVSA